MRMQLCAGLAALVMAGFVPASAQTVTSMGAAAATLPASEQDRRAIRAMAGTFKVRFDFRETTAFLADYKPIAPKTSGAHEVVRVIEDSGDRIALQHILVVETDGKQRIIKHWRQDWVYQPKSVLSYEGTSRWSLRTIEPAEAAGAWSQTVWQTDDSPRYGGLGHWTHDNGVSAWQAATWRPLARRDATRKPPYDRYQGINRHALTPTGWVHEQDNRKIGQRDGKLATFVDEDVFNSYTRFDAFDVAAADTYWAKTASFWAEVRKAWDSKLAPGAIIPEEAEYGSITGPTLMGLADDIAAGKATEAAAIKIARSTISAAGARSSPVQP